MYSHNSCEQLHVFLQQWYFDSKNLENHIPEISYCSYCSSLGWALLSPAAPVPDATIRPRAPIYSKSSPQGISTHVSIICSRQWVLYTLELKGLSFLQNTWRCFCVSCKQILPLKFWMFLLTMKMSSCTKRFQSKGQVGQLPSVKLKS